MDYKEFLLKIYIVLYVIVYWFIGEYRALNEEYDDLGLWAEQLHGKGVRVYVGPLPYPYVGVSWPPLPLIILKDPEGLDVQVLLHEYGHIRAGFMSSEDEADFIMKKCLWRGLLV